MVRISQRKSQTKQTFKEWYQRNQVHNVFKMAKTGQDVIVDNEVDVIDQKLKSFLKSQK